MAIGSERIAQMLSGSPQFLGTYLMRERIRGACLDLIVSGARTSSSYFSTVPGWQNVFRRPNDAENSTEWHLYLSPLGNTTYICRRDSRLYPPGIDSVSQCRPTPILSSYLLHSHTWPCTFCLEEAGRQTGFGRGQIPFAGLYIVSDD